MRPALIATAFTALLAALPATAADRVSIALDWTPNTNHVGLYVAQAKGWFEETGLEVDILPYTDTSPATLVASGVARLGIISDVTFHSQRAAGQNLTAVMAIVQHETAQIVFDGTRDDIQRPADLDGMTYGGFGAEWETALVSTIIRNDGGAGTFDTVTLGTSAYEALASGAVDFTIEISTWEGVQAKLLNRPQRAFVYADYGMPDQHTTFLGADSAWLEAEPDAARAVIQAIQRGYAFAAEAPEAAAEILLQETGGMLSNTALVHASMDALVEGGFLKDPGEAVGMIDPAMVEGIVGFLFEAEILRDRDGAPLAEMPDVSTWFTNAYLVQ